MTREKLLEPQPTPTGADDAPQQIVAIGDTLTPAADPAADTLDEAAPWIRLGMTRLPDGSGYTLVGQTFTLTVNSDLDVSFELDADPSPQGLEESDVRVGLTALILVVWRIAARLGSPSGDASGLRGGTPEAASDGPDRDEQE